MNARTIGADQLFDIFDQNGQALAVGVDAAGAALKAETLMERLDWSGDIVIRRRGASTELSLAARLWLVHDGLDQFGPVTVHVRSPFGFFGLTLEQTLVRIDQFHMQDQHRLRAGIERYFGVGPGQVDQSRHAGVSPAPVRHQIPEKMVIGTNPSKRKEKESA